MTHVIVTKSYQKLPMFQAARILVDAQSDLNQPPGSYGGFYHRSG